MKKQNAVKAMPRPVKNPNPNAVFIAVLRILRSSVTEHPPLVCFCPLFLPWFRLFLYIDVGEWDISSIGPIVGQLKARLHGSMPPFSDASESVRKCHLVVAPTVDPVVVSAIVAGIVCLNQLEGFINKRLVRGILME
jgi:hypothetical protein